MTLPVMFRRVAQSEFAEAAAWYEGHKVGLGDDFLAEVQQTLDIVANHPERYPVADGDVREAPVSRFPYCVYYRVKTNCVVVIAVFHTSRDPSGWQSRS
ncbi:MAG: type II toxin-antitoxin system RelE/ParE family toxin [Gemmataceae bacterium]